MKLLIYWCIANFFANFVGVECRSPSVNNLFRNRPSTTITPSTEETLQQQFSTTTTSSSSTAPTEKNNDQFLALPVTHSTTPASVKVIPAIVAPLNSTFLDKTLSTNLNSTKVPVRAVPIFDPAPVARINKTATITDASIKHGANIRFRLNLNNVSRVTVTRPANASQMFPKRPLLSETMSRYLAIAKEKAHNSTPSSTLPVADKPSHIIAKRAMTIPLLSLDDFVLDIDNT